MKIVLFRNMVNKRDDIIYMIVYIMYNIILRLVV